MPRLYCIPHCIQPDGDGCPAPAHCPALRGRADPSTPGADAPCQTPRGGSNRRPGGAKKSGAPLHARESKNLVPLREPVTHAEIVADTAMRWLRAGHPQVMRAFPPFEARAFHDLLVRLVDGGGVLL